LNVQRFDLTDDDLLQFNVGRLLQMRSLAALLFLLGGQLGFAAETTVEATDKSLPVFDGYANLTGAPVFVIHDPATEESSPWMSLSQTWHGYVFAKFDPKAEKLTLRKDGKDLTLTLKAAKNVEASLRPKLVKGTYTIVDDRIVYSPDAELSFGENNIVKADEGVMTANLEQTKIFGTFRIRLTNGSIMVARDADIETVNGRTLMNVRGGMTSGALPAQ
jgi:hypothetical protein